MLGVDLVFASVDHAVLGGIQSEHVFHISSGTVVTFAVQHPTAAAAARSVGRVLFPETWLHPGWGVLLFKCVSGGWARFVSAAVRCWFVFLIVGCPIRSLLFVEMDACLTVQGALLT